MWRLEVPGSLLPRHAVVQPMVHELLAGAGPPGPGIYQDIVDHHFLDKDPAEMLTLIDISDDIKAEANMILEDALKLSQGTEAVAFHVRRGDMRYFKETDTAQRTNANIRKQKELGEQCGRTASSKRP